MCTPSNTWFSGPTRLNNPNGMSIGSTVFLHSSRQSAPILYNGPPLFDLETALPTGDLDPHLIHGSMRPPESTTQTTSRSVQPFFAGLMMVTDRPTDRPRYSACNNRPHLRIQSLYTKRGKVSVRNVRNGGRGRLRSE